MASSSTPPFGARDRKELPVLGGRDEGFTKRPYTRYSDLGTNPRPARIQAGRKKCGQVLINSNRADSTVLLYLRPTDGVYPLPKLLRLKGKAPVEIAVATERHAELLRRGADDRRRKSLHRTERYRRSSREPGLNVACGPR